MSRNRLSTRRGGREHAFQVLYGLSFSSGKDGNALNFSESAESAERFLRHVFVTMPRNPESEQQGDFSEPSGFAWELVRGVWQERSAIDQAIERFSRHWRIERLGRIELTILRLALYEMLWRREIPPPVAISEALELVSQFGEESAKPFLNGILDAAAKSLMPGEEGEHVANHMQDKQ